MHHANNMKPNKTKARFRGLLHHPARKQIRAIHPCNQKLKSWT